MHNNTRRIVVLDKLNSMQIEQAIFILRDTNENFCESDAVSEAQKIVDNYMRSLSGEKINSSRKKGRGKLLLAMTLYTFATIFLTTYVLAMVN